jgi:ssDNA-binding Zn-finger/Zn-ribbon topoisomerase 1
VIENVKCPLCEGPMTSRSNRATGQRFWGCNDYPKCKGTLNTDGEFVPRRSVVPDEPDRDGLPSERQRDNDRARWRR